MRSRSASASSSFNPRARVEPDSDRGGRLRDRRRFNPRARVEPDIKATVRKRGNKAFQSTGSRGARHDGTRGNLTVEGFNPRARVEPDVLTPYRKDRFGHVSIHGLAWSPTGLSAGNVASSLFQSTGSRGARR